jgi:hypothetical protein
VLDGLRLRLSPMQAGMILCEVETTILP